MSNPNKTVGKFSSRRATTQQEIDRIEESRAARRDPAFDWMCDQIRAGRIFDSIEQAQAEFHQKTKEK